MHFNALFTQIVRCAPIGAVNACGASGFSGASASGTGAAA